MLQKQKVNLIAHLTLNLGLNLKPTCKVCFQAHLPECYFSFKTSYKPVYMYISVQNVCVSIVTCIEWESLNVLGQGGLHVSICACMKGPCVRLRTGNKWWAAKGSMTKNIRDLIYSGYFFHFSHCHTVKLSHLFSLLSLIFGFHPLSCWLIERCDSPTFTGFLVTLEVPSCR